MLILWEEQELVDMLGVLGRMKTWQISIHLEEEPGPSLPGETFGSCSHGGNNNQLSF